MTVVITIFFGRLTCSYMSVFFPSLSFTLFYLAFLFPGLSKKSSHFVDRMYRKIDVKKKGRENRSPRIWIIPRLHRCHRQIRRHLPASGYNSKTAGYHVCASRNVFHVLKSLIYEGIIHFRLVCLLGFVKGVNVFSLFFGVS